MSCELLESRQLLSSLPPNFTETFVTRVATSTASTMAFAPDGRLFVVDSSAGKIRIIKNHALLGTEFLSLSTAHSAERGINGIAFDPNYASGSPYLYVYYTTNAASPVNRLSRFRASANADLADPKEEILLDNIPSPTGFHNGGALHFGADGMLYLGIGDGAGTNGPAAQSLSSLSGKVLRLNATNPAALVPGDNPFVGVSGARPEIFAIGFRNPFTGAIRPGTSTQYINDVGQNTWEEINDVQRGKNYGWPNVEGNGTNPAYVNPLYTYGGSFGSRAITGGAFYTKAQFPAEYQNDYFFADYTQGWIKTYDPVTKAVFNFASGSQQYLDLDVDSAGNLWTLELNGNITRISFVGSSTNRAPFAIVKANPPGNITTGPAPLTINFAGNDSYDPDNPSEPLTFNWDFGDGTSGSGMYVTRTYSAPGTYQARLTVTDTKGASNTSAPFPINVTGGTTTNRAPTARIDGPGGNATYAAGDTIHFWGVGTDPEQGNLQPPSFTWSFVFHHETHTHPFLPDRTGTTWGSFQIPTQGETDPNQWYRITLTVRDAGGLSHSTFVDVKPRTSTFAVASNVPGATLTLDGQPFVTSQTVSGVVNQVRAIAAPATQVINGTTYTFTGWSDGGAATHNIAVPGFHTTFTANYQSTNQPPPPPPTGSSETLRAAADTFVRDGDYSLNIFGSIPDLHVKSSTWGYNREAFLRFPMTSVASVGTAKLRILGRLTGTESTNVPLGLFTTADTNWSETSVNYLSRPAASGPIAQLNVIDAANRWYEFDVTGYVKQQKSAGAGGLGFALKALAASVPYMSFFSDESGNPPQLIVTPASPSSTTTLAVTDDAYVRDGDFANSNFGSAGDLVAKLSTPGFTREFFLRFDLASVSTVNSAKLRLWGGLDNPGSINLAAAGNWPFWTEGAVTFSSRPPPLSDVLATTTVGATAGQWYEWDLTSYVRQRQLLGNTAIGITIRATHSTIQFARFNSSEAASNQPQLVIS